MLNQEVWRYYAEAAKAAGRNREGELQPFSLEFYFQGGGPEAPNDFIRFLQGDPTVRMNRMQPPSEEELLRHTSQVRPPDAGQLDAISKALSYPISLVQGPPGTGKTEMILNLISVLLHCHPGASIAVVSTNNEALANITDKISQDREKDPMLMAISEKFAILGNRQNIKAWRKKCDERGEDVTAIESGPTQIRGSYLRQYPVFSSTVHSLRKIFVRDGAFDGQFDYVIADECSQMSIMLGILTMSCAKNLVLIGDNNQLPPVISRQVKETARYFLPSDVAPQEDERDPHSPAFWMEAEGRSFLRFCEALFPEAPKAFLNCHYRCHPSIIRFCNQYIYQNRLSIQTEDDGQFRMRAVWYEGDYWEKIPKPSDDGKEESSRRLIYNKRQIEIFVREELPRLKDRLQDLGFSVAVISPFRHQIQLLGERLQEALREMDLADSDVHQTLEEDDIPRLTIHKAQGKGFDVVYLLPVEDSYKKEGLWSQRLQSINVAVSRAKQELCVITSSQWLPDELQQKLTGYVLPNEPGKDGLYLRDLLQYIADSCPEPQGDFGFHRSSITSVFDQVPYVRQVPMKRVLTPRRRYPEPAKRSVSVEPLSAPAICVKRAIQKEFGGRYELVEELPLRDIDQTGSIPCGDADLKRYLESCRIDFALLDEDRIRLLLEVDGEYHRSDSDRKTHDAQKDTLIRTLLGAGELFLRLPTDGTTENEMELIREKLSADGPLLTVSQAMATYEAREEARKAQEEARKVQKEACRVRSMLLDRLKDRIDTSYDCLQKFWSRTDLDMAAKIKGIELKYLSPKSVRYDSEVRNSFYLCRYAMAYAFEYAMLYDLALRIHLKSGGQMFGVFSFGAGSLLDAWSMAYAKARLTEEDPRYGGIELYYKGIDKQRWDSFLIEPTRIYSDGDTMKERTQAEDGLFKKTWLYNWDISRFLREDVLGRRSKNLYYDTLIFPKVINELKDGDVEEILDAFRQIGFPRDEHYLLVSHSAWDREKSAEILRKIIEAINRNDRFDVCSSYEELLDQDSRKAFECAWLGLKDDRLEALDSLEPLKVGGEPGTPRCYAFRSAKIGQGGSKDATYIRLLNTDFDYHRVSKEFLEEMDNEIEAARKENEGAGKPGWKETPRTNQVQRVSQIVFSVVRLKRRAK